MSSRRLSLEAIWQSSGGGMELSKLSPSSTLPEGSGDVRGENGPSGRKGGAPNWEEAGAARESTATNEDRGFTRLQLSL